MPTRPREHEIETESRTTLQAAIPSNWVLRNKDQDYGIDGEIEIFSLRRKATGLIFLFQIKGTDEADLAKALAVPISTEVFEYYQTLELPVLLVRYVSSNKKLYAKWIHSFDTYKLRGETTYTLRLSPKDELTPEAIAQIERTSKSLRELKSGTVHAPFQFGVAVSDESFFGMSSTALVIALNRAAQDAGLNYKFTLDSNANLSIALVDGAIRVSFVEAKGHVLHLGADYPQISARCLIGDIFSSIAFLSSSLKLQGPESTLQAFLLRSSIISTETGLAHSVACLAHLNQSNLFQELVDYLVREKKAPEAAHFAFQVALAIQDSNSTFFDAIEASAISFADEVRNLDKSPAAATLNYNIGNAQRHRGRLNEALHSYVRAAKQDHQYKTRDYFWYEIAGILFDLGNYSQSAKCYAKAQAIKNTAFLTSRHADALMFAGQYKDALEQFHKWNPGKGDLASAEYMLKSTFLHFLVDDLKLESQRRAVERAARIVKEAIALNEDSEVVSILQRAVFSDALCNNAWFNLAMFHVKQGERILASQIFTYAALSNRYDAQAWAHALLLGLSGDKNPTHFALTYQSGYFACRDHFLEQIQNLLKQQGPEFNREDFMTEMIAAAELVPHGEGKKTIQVISSDGSYEVLGSDEQKKGK